MAACTRFNERLINSLSKKRRILAQSPMRHSIPITVGFGARWQGPSPGIGAN
jgi:hypothetical protein